MRRLARTVLSAVLVFGGACGGSDASTAPPTDASVVGTYALTIVNGGSLPFPYSGSPTSRFDIISGQITLTAEHTFTDLLTFRETLLAGGSKPDRTDTSGGTWSLLSHTITLTYTGLGVQTAVVTGNRFQISDQGLLLTYSK
jgi:hypothetical protein